MMPAATILPAASALTGLVLAYVDPGTTTSLFALLGPLLALGGVFLGFLLWPFRKALGALFGRKKPTEVAAPPEAGRKPEEGSMTKAEMEEQEREERAP